jgi:hypothetical protein
VLWENLDRILSYNRPESVRALNALEGMSQSIVDHLAMVFHRFVARGPTASRRLAIILNGERLKPWDPFARDEPATLELTSQSVHIEHEGKRHVLRVKPYVLPAQAQFSSVDSHIRAGGPKKWNRQQGFYVYRGDRMIQSGGWNRVRTMDEHSKLARIAIDLPAGVEDLFQINVAKMRVVFPDAMRPQLRALAAGVANRAQEAYRRRLRLVGSDVEGISDVGRAQTSASYSLGDVWPLVTDVLARELRDHPDLLNRVLLALANAQAPLPVARPRADNLA